MSFEFINNPPYGPGGQMYQISQMPSPSFNPNIQQVVQQRPVDPRIYDTPKIVMKSDNNKGSMVPDFTSIGKVKSDEPTNPPEKKKIVSKKKEIAKPGTEIIRSSSNDEKPISGTVEDIPTAYTYAETTGMLRETLGQINAITGELVQEFSNIRASRTMKNKYMALTNISDNLGSLLSSKIAAIREINSSISKSNDLDYKKYKDIKAAASAMDDDKYIADLYKAFLTNPNTQISQPQMPIMTDAMNMSSGIIRANVDNSGQLMGGDLAYMNYMSNLTPEQNLMRYENNPNVKQVVVYDESTGNRWYEVLDKRTRQPVPNVEKPSEASIYNLDINVRGGFAKDSNRNVIYPLVVINNGNTSINEY
jgi:hypothetical protein